MKKDDLQELYLTASLNNLITATFNSTITGIIQEDDKEQYYAHLAKEARAWNKVFDILQQRYSIPTIIKLSPTLRHRNTLNFANTALKMRKVCYSGIWGIVVYNYQKDYLTA